MFETWCGASLLKKFCYENITTFTPALPLSNRVEQISVFYSGVFWRFEDCIFFVFNISFKQLYRLKLLNFCLICNCRFWIFLSKQFLSPIRLWIVFLSKNVIWIFKQNLKNFPKMLLLNEKLNSKDSFGIKKREKIFKWCRFLCFMLSLLIVFKYQTQLCNDVL